jgi:uncharacterized protein
MMSSAVLCGCLVGFVLGLVGGGGSILATPLLLYAVGLAPHRAIGTGALAVAANAFINLSFHARKRHVRWQPAILFAVIGVLGATLGSGAGKRVSGQHLLFLFALLMIVVGVSMLRKKQSTAVLNDLGRSPSAVSVVYKVSAVAFSVGLLSGFFGIGGGFLIVPGLLFATSMPMIDAVGSSLLPVGAFGLTTAATYAGSGYVSWNVASLFIIGGLIGGWTGMRLSCRLSVHGRALSTVFAMLIFVVAAYMLWKTASV